MLVTTRNKSKQGVIFLSPEILFPWPLKLTRLLIPVSQCLETLGGHLPSIHSSPSGIPHLRLRLCGRGGGLGMRTPASPPGGSMFPGLSQASGLSEWISCLRMKKRGHIHLVRIALCGQEAWNGCSSLLPWRKPDSEWHQTTTREGRPRESQAVKSQS